MPHCVTYAQRSQVLPGFIFRVQTRLSRREKGRVRALLAWNTLVPGGEASHVHVPLAMGMFLGIQTGPSLFQVRELRLIRK